MVASPEAEEAGGGFSRSIPAQLDGPKKLKNLLLWENQLVGIIPSELGSCAELTVIDLSLNGLTGHIPASHGRLSLLPTTRHRQVSAMSSHETAKTVQNQLRG